MKRAICALVVSAFSLFAGPVFSQQVSGLYEMEVPVANQGEEARQAGLVAAMEGVLVKMSGRGNVAREAELADLLKAPERYVVQFRYATVSPPAGAGRESGQVLWVKFDGHSLEQLLRSKGVPVWGSVRPAVMVWMALDEKGQRTLVGAGESAPAASLLAAAASRRGLPVRLPLLDLEDRARIQAADVWGGFSDTIRAASVRYGAQAVLTGALFQESEAQWWARWTLYREGDALQRWESAGTLEQAIHGGVGVTTDELARLFAASAESADGPVMVRVVGVRTLEEHLRVTQYLRGLNGVTTVQPVEVAGDEVLLSIALQGPVQAFTQAVGLGEMLAPLEGSASPSPELAYRLVQ